MRYGKTRVILCKDKWELGARSAADVANRMRELLAERPEIRIVFAAGESQATFLDALAAEKNLAWGRIVCFKVDDFHDTGMAREFTCGYQTARQLYDKVHPRSVHLVRYNAPDPEAEARRFEADLRAAGGIDILCQGIGTSGHLALNEPRDTRFDETAWVQWRLLNGPILLVILILIFILISR